MQGAGDKAPVGVHLAVVQPDVRMIEPDGLIGRELAAFEVVAGEAVAQRQDRTAIVPQRHRADRSRDMKLFEDARGAVQGADQSGKRVDPVERLAALVPYRALAKPVARLANADRMFSDHGDISLGCGQRGLDRSVGGNLRSVEIPAWGSLAFCRTDCRSDG